MGDSISKIIISNDEMSVDVIKGYLSDDSAVVFNNFSDAYENIPDTPSIVFLDLSSVDDENILDGIKKIRAYKKSAAVVAISDSTTTETIIKVLRAGAKEFITKPLMKTEFDEILENLTQELDKQDSINSCKVISTFSNKGGIGKTSVAVNLAVELAQMSKETGALIDLNLQLGDVTTFLDMTPSLAMDYIAKNINNFDEEEFLKTLSRYKNTSLYVIADSINIAKSQDVTAQDIKNLITMLKKNFSYIVIDIGTNIDGKTIAALDLSDLILLVAVVNRTAIRSTQRCMELFSRLNYPQDKIKLVLNRYMENEEIKTSDIEEVVKQKVYWKIPNNYLTMMSAINKGVPVSTVNPESNIAINYREFATRLSDYLITQKLNKNQNQRNTYNL